jgi:hypothetical protein
MAVKKREDVKHSLGLWIYFANETQSAMLYESDHIMGVHRLRSAA